MLPSPAPGVPGWGCAGMGKELGSRKGVQAPTSPPHSLEQSYQSLYSLLQNRGTPVNSIHEEGKGFPWPWTCEFPSKVTPTRGKERGPGSLETEGFTWLLGSQGTDRAISDCLQDTRYFLRGKRTPWVSQSSLYLADVIAYCNAKPVLSPMRVEDPA